MLNCATSDKALVPPEDAEYGSSDGLVSSEDDEHDHPPELVMPVQLGAYSAVFVAMCGQVTITTPGGWRAAVHPLSILVLVFLLFKTQLTAVLSLRADMVFSGDTTIASHESEILTIKDPQIQTQVNLKLLMIIILSVVNFDYMLFIMHKIVFLLNPYVWSEIRMRGVGFSNKTLPWWISDAIYMMYTSKVLMMVPALLAMLLRFVITYMVVLDSIGIILTSENVKETIFNGLAIVFILELNTMYWRVLHTVFYFMPAEVSEVKIPFNKGMGGHRRWESYVVSFFAFIVGMRQVALVAYAIHTNISPMARDICTQWRFRNDMGSWTPFTKWLMDAATWIDTSKLIEEFVKGGDKDTDGHFCDYKGKYSRTEWSNMVEVASKYPFEFVTITLLLCVVLVVRDAPDHLVPSGFLDSVTLVTRDPHPYRQLSSVDPDE